jgi:hypothetical protein
MPEERAPGGLGLGGVIHDAVVAAPGSGAAGAGAVAAEHLRGGPAVEVRGACYGRGRRLRIHRAGGRRDPPLCKSPSGCRMAYSGPAMRLTGRWCRSAERACTVR